MRRLEQPSRLALCGLGLLVAGCHPPAVSYAPSNTRLYPDVQTALSCAREALPAAGFPVPPRFSSNPQDSGVVVGERQIMDERAYVAARARVRVLPTADTAVWLDVTATSASSEAIHARDMVKLACVFPARADRPAP